MIVIPDFIPEVGNKLTESTSISLVEKIERQEISTSLSSEAIATAYVRRKPTDQRQGQWAKGFINKRTPILLLHGFDSSVLEFRRLLPLLAEENETWAVDLLGFGFTDRPSNISLNPVSIKTHLYYFWKSLIRQPIILVGASMGGAAAIDFTLTYPEVVGKLVLIDSAGLTQPPRIGNLMFPPLDRLATAFLKNSKVRQNISRGAYYNKSLANEDALLCAELHLHLPGWDRALISFTKSGGYGSFADRLEKIDCPSLILWGANDSILGTKDAKKFQKRLSHSKLVWIDNCGHVPHLEQPQITAKHILNL